MQSTATAVNNLSSLYISIRQGTIIEFSEPLKVTLIISPAF